MIFSKRYLLQSFGFENMLIIHNMKRMGLISEQEQSHTSKHLGKVAAMANVTIPSVKASSFRTLAKKLSLVGVLSGNEIKYIYTGNI